MTQPNPATDPAQITPPAGPARATDPAATGGDATDWKAEARKWEARAKENKTVADQNKAAADKLAEIEEANKTEAQKLADRAAAAELKATQAEARTLRRDVAIEHALTKEDAALLDAITDETAMRALAARLAQQAAATATTVGAHVPGLGQTPAAPSLDALIAEAETKGDTRTAIQLKVRKQMQPKT